ncbi:hypothetical protein Avbf_02456 [Armadillidium vulgare]|nr:hypothetical protein Avbf_02456 [Armadillidium vulgare]
MKISGEILVSGKPRCLKSFQKQSCYIMQDEHLLKYLTVQESMDAAAALKLGKSCQDLSVKSTVKYHNKYDFINKATLNLQYFIK